MKVFNLQCGQGHGFEGWFGSEADYQSQTAGGLLSCPLCADGQVRRLPSAPRLNLGAQPVAPADAGAAQSGAAPPAGLGHRHAPSAAEPAAAFQAQMVQVLRNLVAATEDVGARFAEEARRIHYGEAKERAIRGRAGAEERDALREEGIEVFALPLPPGLEGPLQ